MQKIFLSNNNRYLSPKILNNIEQISVNINKPFKLTLMNLINYNIEISTSDEDTVYYFLLRLLRFIEIIKNDFFNKRFSSEDELFNFIQKQVKELILEQKFFILNILENYIQSFLFFLESYLTSYYPYFLNQFVISFIETYQPSNNETSKIGIIILSKLQNILIKSPTKWNRIFGLFFPYIKLFQVLFNLKEYIMISDILLYSLKEDLNFKLELYLNIKHLLIKEYFSENIKSYPLTQYCIIMYFFYINNEKKK